MDSAVVNFNERTVENLKRVLGAGSELDTYKNVRDLGNALQRGNVYDKILIWHVYPEEATDEEYMLFEEDMNILDCTLDKLKEVPELWFMEGSRRGCRAVYEMIRSNDQIVVQVRALKDIAPILTSAVGGTASEILSRREIVGLYDKYEYEQDIADESHEYTENDESDFTDFEDDFTDDDFADGDVDFDEPDFTEKEDIDEFSNGDTETSEETDAFGEDEFEDGDDFADGEPDEFEDGEDEFEDGDAFADDEPDEFENESIGTGEFEDADEFENESDTGFTDSSEEDAFEESENTSAEDTEFEDGEFTDEEDEEDEFAIDVNSEPDDQDEFEVEGEAPKEEKVTEVVQDNNTDEFVEATVPAPLPGAPYKPQKQGLFAKKPKKKPAGAMPPSQPVKPVAPVQQPVEVAKTSPQSADLDNTKVTLDKTTLRMLRSICAKRCCQVVVTGEKGVGKSTVAMNIAGVLAREFRVLVVDMDGETRGMSYMLNDAIENISLEDSMMRSLFNSGLNSGNKPVTLRKNLSISTCGLSSDTFVTNDTFNATNVSRAHNQLAKYFDFIIYDIPIDACVGKLSAFVTNSYMLYCVDASNYGFMEFLFRLGNLEETALSTTFLESGILIPCKSRGYERVGNVACSSTKSALRSLQRIANEMVGGECELDFENMQYASTLKYVPEIEKCWGTNKLYCDTNAGRKEYSELIARIFGA